MMSKMLKIFLLFLTFVCLLSASPLQTVEKRASGGIIGYRAVPAPVAKIYQKSGLTAQPAGSGSSNQIGPGVYCSVEPAAWAGDWQCAIYTSNLDAWNAANKAWLPESFGTCGKRLWGASNSQNIPEYLQTLNPTWTPQNTILFSYISGFTPTDNRGGNIQVQMLIPNQLVGGSNPLGFSVSCAAATSQQLIDDFKKLPSIDWQSFPNLMGNFPAP